MNLGKFVLFTAIGSGLWNAVLVGLGYGLAKAYPEMGVEELEGMVGRYSTEIGIVIVAVVVIAIVVFILKERKTKHNMKQQFGIIGYPLSSSSSRKKFNEKFEREGIDAVYDLFPLKHIEEFESLIRKHRFTGMNVTIPYKEQVIPYLSKLDETAEAIGAVNTIRFEYDANGGVETCGYNTDAIGFETSLKPLLKPWHKKALILGTGGASKAVAYILKKNGIEYRFVSRTPKEGRYTYEDLTEEIMAEYLLIVNCTPLGMYPPDAFPAIPYEAIGERHLLYDLIYNPEKTLFLEKGEARGAVIKNGLEMLHGQAVAAWKIWTGLDY